MKIYRTPDSCFDNLPGYSFTPNYADIDGMRMHFVDEAPDTGPDTGQSPDASTNSRLEPGQSPYIKNSDPEIILLLHGEPSWSYLYRHMIPVLVSAGFRVIAPDLIGFGRSDKPADRRFYTYERHVYWLTRFLEVEGLKNINLVCQDWGSLLGLRVAAENSDWFSRIILANGGLPTGDESMPKAFKIWKRFARFSPIFPIGKIVDTGCTTSLTREVKAAYDAPFPSPKYKAAARAFPLLVPTSPDNPATAANRAAWDVFRNWDKPFLTAFSDKDPITRGGQSLWQKEVPGARGRRHPIIEGAGHFLQEDKGVELANVVAEFIRTS
ncbi:MAG: haloalkane dehalogenase [Pseudomonadota bacterium]